MRSWASWSLIPSCVLAQNNAAYRDLPWMTEEELLNQPGLQAVLVETRVRDLLNTAERCIGAGKHAASR